MFLRLSHLPKKQHQMKTLMNNTDKTDSLNKMILRSILELQTLLNDYQLDESSYDQDRTSEVQTAIDALDILMIRILNKS